MSPEEVVMLREQLLERRDFLIQEHGAKILEVSQSADHSVADEFDLASEAADFDVTVHTAFRDGEELESVIAAIRKLDDGTYGSCEDCNKSINPKRLQALPFATLCIDCQRDMEKSGRLVRTAFSDSGYQFDEE